MLRTNRETFPDELTGPHVEHLTGLSLVLGQSAEEVMARKKRNGNTSQAGQRNKKRWKEETKQHPVLMCHASVQRAYMSVWICASV